MAQKKTAGGAKRASSTGKKSGNSRKKTTASAAPRPAPQEAPQPIRREVGGVFFLLMAVFTTISYFTAEGSFIEFFSNFIKGMLGWGFWLTAPAFLICTWILFTHRGRPVMFRVISALLLPVLFGSIAHLLIYVTPLVDSLQEFTGLLFEQGQQLESGGAISGLIAYGLQSTVSVYGAMIVLVVAFVFFLFRALGTSMLALITAEKNRPRAQYDPSRYPDFEEDDPVQPAQTRGRNAAASRNETTVSFNPADLSVEEDWQPVQPDYSTKKKKNNHMPEVQDDWVQPVQIQPAQKKRKTPQVPIDIPLGEEEEYLSAFGSNDNTDSFRRPAARSAARTAVSSSDPVITPLNETPVTPSAKAARTRVTPVARTVTAETDAAQIMRPATVEAKTSPVTRSAVQQTTVTSDADVDEILSTISQVKAKPTKGKAVKPLSETEAAAIAGVTLEKTESVKTSVRNAGHSGDSPVAKISREDVEKETQAVTAAIEANGSLEPENYQFPPIDLLRSSEATSREDRNEIAKTQERLEGALHSFGIPAQVVGVIHGPTVTRYDIELQQGVKLARVTNLAGDIALALGVVNVRIAPIPDQISTVGIEVPNKIVTTVYLRDIIESSAFRTAKSRLTFSLGKDIGGNAMVGNISKLPHLLIAGTTGSGKSVCMNSLILSILYKSRPDEVRFIMVDPKMVELGIYNGIPHLYVPVVTDPKKAAGALQWSVVEMLKRYRRFSEMGVRDLDTFNAHCAANGEEPMPRVVIIIDELADLMLVASKEVEESICRVAQMGRAAGMHLVIATQRPSADVITGLMKANIPSRIAFAVSSSLESRIILDQTGAEKLVGMGDMLYSPVGLGKPVRIQGAFVSDEEREDVINFIKENAGTAESNSEISEYMDKAAEAKNADNEKGNKGGSSAKDDTPASDYDEMLPQAVEVVLEMKQCSVSMLQRRLKLGYSRAARVVDQLEELGVVGPYEGAKPRSVVIDREGWNELQVKLGLASEDDFALAADMSDTAENELNPDEE